MSKPKNPCVKCKGLCCKYFGFEIDTPKTRAEFDNLRVAETVQAANARQRQDGGLAHARRPKQVVMAGVGHGDRAHAQFLGALEQAQDIFALFRGVVEGGKDNTRVAGLEQ